MGEFISAFEKEGLKYTKSGVQLPNNRELPLKLIEQIVLFNCVQERVAVKERREPTVRPEKPLPDYLKEVLACEGLLESYYARPRYQRTDYISWIERGVMEETRQKRIGILVDELRCADRYMGRAYNAKK